MKNLVILGSTGSIGTQTLDVIDHLKDEWQVMGLSANTNITLLEEQARKYSPSYLVVMNENLAKELEYSIDDLDTKVLTGLKGLNILSAELESDLVINALVGAIGLSPTVTALKAGRKLGLANKESLVIGGEIIKEYISNILPIDSEHNAIFQVLSGHKPREIQRLILTASGGPFRQMPADKFKDITVDQALAHPNWEMGGKVTIDSATLMNKGLEVIEAHWLFGQPYDKIEVIVHPQSIVHSMVEFIDGSILAELGVADMRSPIQYVMSYPDRAVSPVKRLNFNELGIFSFEEPDLKRFPALKLAYLAGNEGGTLPVVLNASNEIAVSAFLNKRISFLDIPVIIEQVMLKHQKTAAVSLEDILEVDRWARDKAEGVITYVVDNN